MPDDKPKPVDTPRIKQSIHANTPAMHARMIEYGMEPFLRPCAKVYVGTGGNITMLLAGDTEPVTFKNIPGGTEWDWSVTQFIDGTASDILAIF